MKHWMFSCRDVCRLVSESLDRRMSFKGRMGIRIHLGMCPYCRRHKRQLEFIRELMAAYRRHLEQNPATDQLSTEAKLRMKLQLCGLMDQSAPKIHFHHESPVGRSCELAGFDGLRHSLSTLP